MASQPQDSAGPGSAARPASRGGSPRDRHDDAAPQDASSETGDRIRPIVAEIRQRVSALASHEVALRQREQELEQHYRLLLSEARQTAQREWAEARERLAQRSAELDAQSVELAARSSRLVELEQRLTQREAQQERSQQDLGGQLTRLRRRAEAYRGQREEERRQLRRRIATIRQREAELERRIRLAREDIVQQRKELEQRRATLREQTAGLEDDVQELAARKATLERELGEFQSRPGEVEARGAERAATRTEQENRQYELQSASRGLEKARRELSEKLRGVDERWRQTRAQRHQLARQTEELDARRRVLQEQEAACEQRRQRLENYDQQLRGRAAALESEAEPLAQAEAALARRADAVDALARRAEQAAAEVQRRREKVLRLREQTQAREAEGRQLQLSLELEREEVRKQGSALALAQDELARGRQERDAQFERVRAALAGQAERLRLAERSLLRGPQRWWLRGGVLAAVAGLLAGAAWWAWDQPVYRASCELRLAAGCARPAEVLAEHERRLRMPGVIGQVLEDVALVRAWEAARVDDRVDIGLVADRPAIRVSLTGPDRAFVRRLVQKVSAGYRRLAATLPRASPATTLPSGQRAALDHELQMRQAERRELAKRAESLASAEQRDQVRAATGQLRSDCEKLGQALVRARGRLAGMLSAPVPRGTVSPADYEQALAADEMYLEDRKEFRTAALQYRSELAVAMLLVTDAPHGVRQVLGALVAALAEQRELKPPPAVAAALEEAGAAVSALDERLTSFAQQWAALFDAVQATNPEQQLVELVQRQHAAHDEVQKLCAAAHTLLDGLHARLDRLSEEADGRTRAVVVAAVLRGELSKLTEAVAALDKAAESTDLAKNFRLDALVRQLRGLRTRLERREAMVRQRLQFEADDRARQQHAARVSKLRQTTQELDQRREGLIGELSDKLDELWRLDAEVFQRHEVEAAIGRQEAAIATLQEKIGQFDQARARAESGGPAGPTLEVGPLRVVTVAGAQRHRNAALLGLATLAATGALCLLMIVKNPLRRVAWRRSRRHVERLQTTMPAQGPACHPPASSPPAEEGKTEA